MVEFKLIIMAAIDEFHRLVIRVQVYTNFFFGLLTKFLSESVNFAIINPHRQHYFLATPSRRRAKHLKCLRLMFASTTRWSLDREANDLLTYLLGL